VSTPQTVLLGAIAGLTIFLGLPVGRLRTSGTGGKAFLNALSAGILLFSLLDILEHATGPLDHTMEQAIDGQGSWGQFAAHATVYVLGLGVGLLGLFYLARRLQARARTSPPPASLGPGAMAAAETPAAAAAAAPLRLGMAIAVGIGLHNFSEGLAIGQAASSGALSLAALLIIGFGLHNATEGFGIVGPPAAAGVRPSWGWLGLAGLVGGGPTFAGTLLGMQFDSSLVYVGFLTLAAGAIIYVLGELLPVGRRLSWELTVWGLGAGFLLGLATELVVEAAGG
jgi:ZIP family zinc transporter